ncbi:hypothetical protein MNBD_GAMMA16-1212 [hydrothermal vent metagenome]|uniref:Spondin domain-containing protein n=1 Tax=hydrothermal vent metagenome TaxID=652676 RepID=A0A3B0Z8B8_9ZZZZ
MNKSIRIATLLAFAGATLLLQGCFHNDDDNANNPDAGNETTTAPTKIYTVTVSNLTNNQEFSAVGAVLHSSGYHAFTLGSAADEGLERLAEGGDNSIFLNTAKANSKVMDTVSGVGHIRVGDSETLTTEGFDDDIRLTLATMPINTNDAFVALNAINISDLASGESMVLHARAYDAGTEGNNETSMEVPGQGGEGFNAARNDRDFVAVHAGIVGMDDGLTGSALNQSHRFDNPLAKIVVTRTQ